MTDFMEYMAVKLHKDRSETREDLLRSEQGALIKEVGYSLTDIIRIYRRKKMVEDVMEGGSARGRLLQLLGGLNDKQPLSSPRRASPTASRRCSRFEQVEGPPSETARPVTRPRSNAVALAVPMAGSPSVSTANCNRRHDWEALRQSPQTMPGRIEGNAGQDHHHTHLDPAISLGPIAHRVLLHQDVQDAVDEVLEEETGNVKGKEEVPFLPSNCGANADHQAHSGGQEVCERNGLESPERDEAASPDPPASCRRRNLAKIKESDADQWTSVPLPTCQPPSVQSNTIHGCSAEPPYSFQGEAQSTLSVDDLSPDTGEPLRLRAEASQGPEAIKFSHEDGLDPILDHLPQWIQKKLRASIASSREQHAGGTGSSHEPLSETGQRDCVPEAHTGHPLHEMPTHLPSSPSRRGTPAHSLRPTSAPSAGSSSSLTSGDHIFSSSTSSQEVSVYNANAGPGDTLEGSTKAVLREGESRPAVTCRGDSLRQSRHVPLQGAKGRNSCQNQDRTLITVSGRPASGSFTGHHGGVTCFNDADHRKLGVPGLAEELPEDDKEEDRPLLWTQSWISDVDRGGSQGRTPPPVRLNRSSMFRLGQATGGKLSPARPSSAPSSRQLKEMSNNVISHWKTSGRYSAGLGVENPGSRASGSGQASPERKLHGSHGLPRLRQGGTGPLTRMWPDDMRSCPLLDEVFSAKSVRMTGRR